MHPLRNRWEETDRETSLRSDERSRSPETVFTIPDPAFNFTGMRTPQQTAEIRRGKDFVQLKNGPFDVELVFAPDGIERFEDAWRRGADINGCPVCSIEDIIASKQASNRPKDRDSLPRLRSFRDYLREPGREQPPRLPSLRTKKAVGVHPMLDR